ncbi:MAG: LysM domain-containing protein [bacterium]|nr:LysM domain-containing protein [bacterium]
MSRTRHRRYLALLGLTVGIALVLTSCFGGDDEPEDATPTTQAEPQPPPPPPTVAEPPPPPPTIVAEPQPPPPTIVAEPQPPPPTVVTEPLIYTVQQGDTLFSIAQQFGVAVDELIELNNIANPDVIFVDDTLTIPPR